MPGRALNPFPSDFSRFFPSYGYSQSRRVSHRMPARAFARFLTGEYFGGVLLLLATASAMVLANSPFAQDYWEFLHGDIGFAAGKISLHMSVSHWINDGLMVLFFLVVGLEIKREFLGGELASRSKAFLPVICAIGGVVV